MARLDRSGEPCYGASVLAAALATYRIIPLATMCSRLDFLNGLSAQCADNYTDLRISSRSRLSARPRQERRFRAVRTVRVLL